MERVCGGGAGEIGNAENDVHTLFSMGGGFPKFGCSTTFLLKLPWRKVRNGPLVRGRSYVVYQNLIMTVQRVEPEELSWKSYVETF